MPAGQIIGRVAVKVLPNTDTFRVDAQRQLDRIEDRLSVTVQAKIDLTGGLRDALVELRRINQENRVNDGRKMRIYTTIGTTNMDEEITKALRKLQDKADGRKIRIHADLVGAVLATDLDQTSLKHVEHQLHDWANNISPIKIEVKPDLATGFGIVVSKRLQILTRPRTVPILPHLNESAVAKVATGLAALSGARVISTWFKDMADTLGRLDKSVPLIGSLALAVAGLAGWALAGASNLFVLSASLAQIGPLAVALPGIFGAFGLGLIASAVALKDINKHLPDFAIGLGRAQTAGQAWKALQDSISANFWAQAVAPFKELVRTLFPQFSAGMNSISTQLGGFFGQLATGFTGVFDGALKGMFDDLSASIKIATGGTAALADIIKILGQTGAGFLPRLAQWFVDIANKFDAWLSKAAADGRLKQWIETALDQLHALGQVLVNVTRIFFGIAQAAEQAGGSSLQMFADTLGRIADVVNGPAFQQQLVSVLMAAHQAMTLIGTQSGPAVTALFSSLSATLATLLPQVGQVIGQLVASIATALASPVFQQGLTAFFAGIISGAQALVPAIGPVSDAIAAIGTAIGTFAAQLGPTIAQAFTVAAQAVQILAPAIQQLLPPLGELVRALIDALGPVVPIVAQGLAALAPALGAVATFLTPLAPLIVTVVAAWKAYTAALAVGKWVSALADSNIKIFAWAGNQLIALGNVVKGWATSVGAAIASMASYVAANVSNAASAAAAWVAAQVRTVASLAVTAAGFVAQGATIVASMAATAASVVAGWVVMGVQSLIQAARMAAAWIIAFGPIGIIVAAVVAVVAIIIANWDTITEATSKAWAAVKDWIGQAWDWITDKVSAAVDAVKTVISTVFEAIKTAIQLYLNAWKQVISTVWDAITTVVSAAVNAVKLTISTVFTAVKGFIQTEVTGWKLIIETVWNAIKTVVSAAVNGVKAAVTGLSSIAATIRGYFDQARQWASDKLGDLVAVVKGLPGRAKAALGNLGDLLANAGRSLIEGFINGIKAMFGAVKSALGDLTSKLTSWKGPESLDRVLLVKSGQLIIDGFVTGLESRYATVRRSLAGLSAQVAGTTIDPIAIGSATARLSTQITAALTDGGSGQVTKVLNYYAAPGSSLSAEDDLFTAAGRARMVGW